MSKYADLYAELVAGGDSEETASATVDRWVAEDIRAGKYEVEPVEVKPAPKPVYQGWVLAMDTRTGRQVKAQVRGDRVRVLSMDGQVPGAMSLEAAKVALKTVRDADGKQVRVADCTGVWNFQWGR
jgi:hypothetical protein